MASKFVRYQVITETNLETFTMAVVNAMHQGWAPVGGVSTTTDSANKVRYSQAMVEHNAGEE